MLFSLPPFTYMTTIQGSNDPYHYVTNEISKSRKKVTKKKKVAAYISFVLERKIKKDPTSVFQGKKNIAYPPLDTCVEPSSGM